MQQSIKDAAAAPEPAGHGVWRVVTSTISMATGPAPSFYDLTDAVEDGVEQSRIRAGQATIFSRHTTAAIKINEHEPYLLQDMARMLRRAAPPEDFYGHNDFTRRTVNMTDDECANGHAHCAHLLLGSSETIPILEGRLLLGPWQRIFLIELDHPRTREVVLSILGIST